MNTPQINKSSNARCGIRRYSIKSVIVTFIILMFLPVQAFAQNNPTTPTPAPSVDADELCTKATKAKFQKDLASKCKAYDLYKKAKEAGIKDPKCQKAADQHIAAYASKCDATPSTITMPSTAAPSVDADELCTEGTKAKFQSDIASKCKAYDLYKQAKLAGINNPRCQKQADAHIAAYASKCDSAPSPISMPLTAPTPAQAPSDDNDKFCNEAAKAKIQKDNCKAYSLYKQAKKAGINNPRCQKAADQHIAAYASKCK